MIDWYLRLGRAEDMRQSDPCNGRTSSTDAGRPAFHIEPDVLSLVIWLPTHLFTFSC
jgi:hypothetical protein